MIYRVLFCLLALFSAGCVADGVHEELRGQINTILDAPLAPLSLVFEPPPGKFAVPANLAWIRLDGRDASGNSHPLFPLTLARSSPQPAVDIPVTVTNLTVQLLEGNLTVASQAVLPLTLLPETPVTLSVPFLNSQIPALIYPGKADPLAISTDGNVSLVAVKDENNLVVDYQLNNQATSTNISLLNVDDTPRRPSLIEGCQPRLSADASVACFGYSLTPDADRLAAFDVATGTSKTLDPLEMGPDVRGSYGQAVVSCDGRFIAYKARTPLPSRYSENYDIFLFDRQKSINLQLTHFSRDFGEEPSNSNSPIGVAPDGRFVIVKTALTNSQEVEVLCKIDCATLVSTLLPKTADTFNESLAAQGEFLAFEDESTNQVIRMNLTTLQGMSISRGQGELTEEEALSLRAGSSISSDGRFLAFYSKTSLLRGALPGVYLKDMQANLLVPIGLQGWVASGPPLISGDGKTVLFTLADGDLNPAGIGSVRNPLDF